MRILYYDFGIIKINNFEYRKDIIINKDKIYSPWIRNSGHLLILDDIKHIIGELSNNVIIGTGYSSMMKVDKSLIEFFRKNNIKYYIGNSVSAVEKFNSLTTSDKTLLIHLTC